MTIALKGSQLFSTVTGQPKVPLFAETGTRFSFKAMEAQCEFIKDEKGAKTHAVLYPAKIKVVKK